MTNKQENNAPIDKWMIARTVVLFVALINQFLVLNGLSPLPFEDAQVENSVTVVLTISASLWAWWKNNNITYKARRNEDYMKKKGLK
ncbi:phage holin [Sporosarcina sp. FSL K6-1522]|uniref:phage holin n=1 Tax=Sporosarcina sp. FSL K6-1522 TaxID=2921554 RepID=UPI00315A60B7